jgi:hypothetical protein
MNVADDYRQYLESWKTVVYQATQNHYDAYANKFELRARRRPAQTVSVELEVGRYLAIAIFPTLEFRRSGATTVFATVSGAAIHSSP